MIPDPFFLLKKNCSYVYMCVSVRGYVHVSASASGGQKGALEALELPIVSYQKCVLKMS